MALFTASPAEAILWGVDHIKLCVNDVDYMVPLIDLEKRQIMREVKLAIEHGDPVAREMLLSGKEERWIYIGQETPLWLLIKADSEEVIKP